MARARSGYHRSGDALVDALARARPRTLRVEAGDDTHEVRCAGARVRWTHVAQTVRELADGEPARVVMMDADGGTVGVVRVDATPTEDAPPTAPMDARDERILTLLVSAQRAALDEQRALLAPVLESYTALARGYAEYAAQVVELVRLAASVREQVGAESPADRALVDLAAKVVGAPTVGAPTNGAK